VCCKNNSIKMLLGPARQLLIQTVGPEKKTFCTKIICLKFDVWAFKGGKDGQLLDNKKRKLLPEKCGRQAKSKVVSSDKSEAPLYCD
jgi:hypothetical protein